MFRSVDKCFALQIPNLLQMMHSLKLCRRQTKFRFVEFHFQEEGVNYYLTRSFHVHHQPLLGHSERSDFDFVANLTYPVSTLLFSL